MKAIVIGGGVGGLMVATRLATSGRDVTLFERAPTVGGKLATLEEEGWSFDLGPSVLTLPHVFDEVFRLAGTALDDEVELVRLDPQFRYRWPNGSTLEVPDDPASFRQALDTFSPGAGEQWAQFDGYAAGLWERVEPGLLGASNGGSRSRRAGGLDAGRTLSKVAASHLDDPRLQQLVGRYATYWGSSPFKAPATFAYLAHVEQRYGVWYTMGGLGRIRDALERIARSVGVDIRTGTDIGRIVADRGRTTGVGLADGGFEPAEIVVSDVDAAHLYTDLFPNPKQAKLLDKVQRSTSAFVVFAAVRGRSEGIAHHNVFFPLHDRQEHRYLEAGQMPIDQTIHACVSSVTDPARAPADCENWYLSVATPPAIGIDRRLMTAAVLNRLAERGVDLRERIDYTRTMVPADFEARYRAVGGAIHGTSSNGKRAAFSRPDNLGPVDGLYLVGGSTRPGAGLPSVAASARIVADLVADRHE